MCYVQGGDEALGLWWTCACGHALHGDCVQSWFYVCLCLKTSYSVYVVGSVMLNLLPYGSCLNEAYLTHSFSLRHHSLPVLGRTRQHFSTMLGGHFKQWNCQKKHKNAKNVALNRLRKGHLFIVWVESRSRAWPSLTSAGNTRGGWLWVFTTLCTSENDHEGITRLIWGLQRDFSKWANSQIWNSWITRIECTHFSQMLC